MLVITGGTGKLGTELKKLFTDAVFPSHEELDVKSPYSIVDYFNIVKPSYILHCAAFASPIGIDQNPLEGLRCNILGTAFLAEYALQKNIPMAYISTDYVFDGDLGDYTEEDSVFPVGLYAWSKLGGECAVNMLPKHLIMRLSFTPLEFPYDKAPTDQYTSRLTVDKIAEQVYILVSRGATGTYHLGGPKRRVWDIAQETAKKPIEKCTIADFAHRVPRDASFDTSKFKNFKENT
jgi:dTDP-4-dehydrorhamnose reductase